MNVFWKIKFMISVLARWSIAYLTALLSVRDKSKENPTHVIFCLVDHFEPGTGNVNKEVEDERMAELLTKYPKLADNHKDFHGNIPKRTWFFPPHYHRNNNLKKLVSLCERGYGEIELHLHHGKTCPDTSANLKDTIMQSIKEYSEFGIFGFQNGEKKYAFIHGDWALDNSRNGKFCGVNNEIHILNSTGCFADFTFPSKVLPIVKTKNGVF